MFDHKTMTYNGTAVAYATLPMYMLNIVMLDDQLTPAAKLVFVRLMAYASAVGVSFFGITAPWVQKNTGLCRKTVSRSLELLTQHGYLNENGLVYAEPPKDAKRGVVKQFLPTQSVPSVQVHHFADATKMVVPDISPKALEVDLGIDLENTDDLDLSIDFDIDQALTTDLGLDLDLNVNLEQDVNIGDQLNDLLKSLGSTKKVGKKVSPSETPVEKMSQPSGQKVPQLGKNVPPYITIPKNNQKENTPAPSVAVGMLPSTSSRGFVEPSRPKPLASFLPTLGKGQTVAIGKPLGNLSQQHTSYIATALQRMKVTSPSERKRYTDEIAYAATQGAFAQTYRHTPLKAIRACLNLVEAGKWRANGGVY